MLENIAGWRPHCGWLGYRWVCRAANVCPKSIRSGNGWSQVTSATYC